MKMQNWLHARSTKLLEEINNTPLTDDSDEIKMRLIMSAMRESSVEMFHRAAENSRKEIEKINSIPMQKSIMEVESVMADDSEDNVYDKGSNVDRIHPEDLMVAGKDYANKITTEAEEEEKPVKEEPKIKLSSSVIRRTDSF